MWQDYLLGRLLPEVRCCREVASDQHKPPAPSTTTQTLLLDNA